MNNRIVLCVCILSTYLIGAEIQFDIGARYNDSFKMMGKTIYTTPQIAVWVESTEGAFVQTLMVTRKSAKGAYAGHRGGREESLPVWCFARNKVDKKGRYAPTRKNPLPDAVTGASEKSDFSWSVEIAEQFFNGDYRLCVEVNNSMDFNSHYGERVPKESVYYNNGVNGQPSLVFKGDLGDNETACRLVGYGDPAGSDGELSPIDSTLTSALQIIKNITVLRGGE